MKILVTGADGYLGQGIVKELIDQNYDVIAAGLNAQNIDSRATIVEGNIFDVNNPFDYYGQPSVLLHLAWRDGFIHNSDAHMFDLPKHAKFIDNMANSSIDTVAVLGTMHEIGFYEGSIDENTPCHPENYYGIAKNSLRDYTKLVCKMNKKNMMWLRGYYIVGNTKMGESIFSKITRAEEEGKKIFPFTMGQNQYDFIDYSDFCKQVVAAITQDKIKGIINIGSGKPEKLADRVERFIRENNYNIKLEYGAYPDRPYDSKAVWGNNSKIESIMKSV